MYQVLSASLLGAQAPSRSARAGHYCLRNLRTAQGKESSSFAVTEVGSLQLTSWTDTLPARVSRLSAQRPTRQNPMVWRSAATEPWSHEPELCSAKPNHLLHTGLKLSTQPMSFATSAQQAHSPALPLKPSQARCQTSAG